MVTSILFNTYVEAHPPGVSTYAVDGKIKSFSALCGGSKETVFQYKTILRAETISNIELC
jgi:hypothetical protein